MVTDGMQPAEIVSATALYFAYLDDEMNSMFEDAMAEVIGILRANPAYKLDIIGHSDVDETIEAKVNGRYAGLAL